LRNKFLVGICRCPSYEPDLVKEAISVAMERSGGGPFLLGDILLKVNLLSPAEPEKAVTTHPEVITALLDWIYEREPEVGVSISDSPGYLFSGQWPLFVEKCRLAPLLGKYPCKVAPLNEEGYVEIENSGAVELGKIRIPSKVRKSGTVFNVAKCKTHVETEITGCLKNTFGYLDTPTRKLAHRSGSLEKLCHAILDAHISRAPDWHLVDAVQGMEGAGPSHGTARHIGWIVASDNALAADFVLASIMGYKDPLSIPLLAVAANRSMGPAGKGEIDLSGAAWEDLPAMGFTKAPSSLRRIIPTPIRGLAHSMVRLKPSWSRDSCSFCGACSVVCPVKALKVAGGKIEIERRLCVHCLCCHEMCPTGAMAVKPNLLARLLLR